MTIVDRIEAGEIDLVINVPRGRGARTDGYEIRRAALQHGVPTMTNAAAAHAVVQAIAAAQKRKEIDVVCLQDLHGLLAASAAGPPALESSSESQPAKRGVKMTARCWKVTLFIALVALGGMQTVGCGGSDTTATTVATEATAVTATSDAGQEFTIAELAEFDGKDGRPAYVAVDGVVYDVSDSSRWGQGSHSSCSLGASAGRDLSDVIQQAPGNMRALLARMPVVGSWSSRSPVESRLTEEWW